MFSLIVCSSDGIDSIATINSFIDTSKYEHEIIICCDDKSTVPLNDAFPNARIITYATVDRTSKINEAVKSAKYDKIIIVDGCVKFSDNLCSSILKTLQDRSAVAIPSTYGLDKSLWCAGDKYYSTFSFQWNLRIRYGNDGGQYSPLVCPSCFAFNKSWVEYVEYFDDLSLVNYQIEFSLRTWLLGGKIVKCGASIASSCEMTYKVDELARIAEVWLPAYSNYFYDEYVGTPIDCGRLNDLINVQNNKQSITSDEFLKTMLPELLSAYNFRNLFVDKTIAIVCDGASIDFIDRAVIYRNDVIISVNYMGLVFDSDYNVSFEVETLNELTTKYNHSSFVLPTALSSSLVGGIVRTSDVFANSAVFELDRLGYMNDSAIPPFANFDSPIHFAIHFAMMTGSTKINVYGCDDRMICGRSYTSLVDFYDNMVDGDTDNIRKRYEYYRYGYDMLGKLADKLGVKLIRIGAM